MGYIAILLIATIITYWIHLRRESLVAARMVVLTSRVIHDQIKNEDDVIVDDWFIGYSMGIVEYVTNRRRVSKRVLITLVENVFVYCFGGTGTNAEIDRAITIYSLLEQAHNDPSDEYFGGIKNGYKDMEQMIDMLESGIEYNPKSLQARILSMKVQDELQKSSS